MIESKSLERIYLRNGHEHEADNPRVTSWVLEGTMLMTDDAVIYKAIDLHGAYGHESVNHSETHTNNIEAFWALLKRGIRGTYMSVSKKHLQKYLWEFEYRHKLRHAPCLMLPCLMVGFAKPARRA